MSTSKQTPKFLPWVIWSVAVLFYIVAMLNRTSLSALGPTAQEHFDIQSTVLSSFAVLQLVTYAAMQIPVGMLLDRFGISLVLVTGSSIMFLSQIVMALSNEVWFAVVARMFMGAGDAFIFISVMRMLPDWFQARQLPILGQITGQIGWIGQIISLIPLSLAVEKFGWSAGFLGISATGLLITLLGLVVMRDKPGMRTIFERIRGKSGSLTERSEDLIAANNLGLDAMPSTTEALGTIKLDDGASVFKKLKLLLAIPGVRLAFWVHFTPPFAQTTLLLLWGTPFLTGGMGLDPMTSSLILTLTILASTVGGLIFGQLTSKFVEKRVLVAVGSVVMIALLWAPIFLWQGTPPLVLVIVAIMFTVLGGPASMIAFEIVRSYAPRRMIGVATGMVNMGGFISTLLAIFIVGIVLDLLGAGTPETYRLDAFQWALSAQYIFWGIGLWRIFAELRNTRKWRDSRTV